jgi:ABC-type nitrate/sulfonate/bicarbonate transport system substrate-binding protein
MTVVSTTVMTAKPDQYEAFVASIAKSKKLLEKHGAKNVRLLANMVGGAFGSFALAAEYEDFAAAGKGLDKFLTDAEGVALMKTSTGEAGGTASVQSSMWIEIPL